MVAPHRLVRLGVEQARPRAVRKEMAEGGQRDVTGGDEGEFHGEDG